MYFAVIKMFWIFFKLVASEEENMHDKFAVALSSAEVGMVGHVPRECFIAEPLPVDRKVFYSSIDVVVVLCPVLQYFQLLLPRIKC